MELWEGSCWEHSKLTSSIIGIPSTCFIDLKKWGQEDWVNSFVGLVQINHVTNVWWFSTQLVMGLKFMITAAQSHRYINPDDIPLENTISHSFIHSFIHALVPGSFFSYFPSPLSQIMVMEKSKRFFYHLFYCLS